MIYTIANNELSVVIDSKGGELQSIKSHDGTEYLWQADEKYWGAKAPNLFPYIARLTNGEYKLYGKTYKMNIHGFLKDSNLVQEEYSSDKLILSMRSNNALWKQYPFQFMFYIVYKLEEKKLKISYIVENCGQTKMYFAIGGHPGFNVPLEAGLDFEDYYLEFAEESELQRVGMSEDCYVTGEDEPFALIDGKKLAMQHSMFDDDAIILKNMSKEVTLKSDKSDKTLTVAFPEMDYLGLWHMPRTDAPYICIEPWTSLPSRKDIVEELTAKEDMIELEPRGYYTNTWWIAI